MARLGTVLACGLAAMAGCGGDEGSSGADGGADLLGELRAGVERFNEAYAPLGDAATASEVGEPPPGPSYELVRVLPGNDVVLRTEPGGPVAAKLGPTTEFGSERHFWVAKRRDGWLGVPSAALPNGELGWIRGDPSVFQDFRTPYAIEADLSERLLELRFGNRVLERFEVGVGGASTPTPTGAYSVTDGLLGEGLGPYYGCCVLALSGHQPNLPDDWIGGDRIAIHGTPDGSGAGDSAGCLRASDTEMVSLFARVPLGAPVFIRP